MKNIRIISLFLFAWLVASCAQGAAPVFTPTPTLVTLPTAVTRLETLVLPTDTATATITVTPTIIFTPTLTIEPSITSSPTAVALFEKAQVTSLTTPGDQVRVAIKVPGIKSVLNIILNARPFNCQMDAKAPEVLFCVGKELVPVAKQIPLIFVDPQSGAQVYSGTTYIINQAVPTPTPAGYANCPTKGKNKSCEIECRLYSGNPCLVASCFDDCGLYRSINDCPIGVQNEGICSEDLLNEMKTKYGIP